MSSRHLTLYVVRSGDTLTRIARQHGIADWRHIYHAPENADFRRKRPNPDRIFPGDHLVIPAAGPRVAFELPPGAAPPGSAPPPGAAPPPGSAPPGTTPPAVAASNTDFIFALPGTAVGHAGFDATRPGERADPHLRRNGVRPWTLVVGTQRRTVELIRFNTAARLMPQLDDLDFVTLPPGLVGPLEFSGGNSPGAPISMTIVPARAGTATITAVHRASGSQLADITVDVRARKALDGLLPVRVQVATTQPAAASAFATALDAARLVYFEQAGIDVQTLPPIDHTTFARKGETVDEADLDAIWAEIKARHKPARVRAPIMLVPALITGQGNAVRPINGVTRGAEDSSLRLIAISSKVQRLDDTITHELGHLQDLDFGNEAHPSARGFPANFMFGDNSVDRTVFYRDQILRLNKP
jgi:hypothetical protein